MTVITKTGDKGETGVLGKRLPKDDLLIEAIGEIDELMAVVGMVKLRKIGEKINSDLYRMMGYLSGYAKEIDLNEDTKMMEADIQKMEMPIGKFLKPGIEMDEQINWVRTVARRAERRVVAAGRENDIDNSILIYLNRLSDYLFILSVKK